MSLREQQMAARRTRILDNAERVIRKIGGIDFSMRSLAAAAETSPATPYNLFGSKEGLLYALLSRSLDEITRRGLAFKSRDPLEQILEAADNAVDIFLDDPNFLRPLYQFLLGVIHPVYRPRFIERSLGYWRTALDSAAAAGLLSADFDRNTLAHALMAHFMGVLEFWIHEDVDDAGFRAHVGYGTALQLWPLAHGTRLPKLLRKLRAAQQSIRYSTSVAAALSVAAPIQLSTRRSRG